MKQKTKFVSMQNHYSLIYREEEREMNKFCRETGVGLIPVSLRSISYKDITTHQPPHIKSTSSFKT